MFRNSFTLAALVLVSLSIPGCSLFGKKQPQSQLTNSDTGWYDSSSLTDTTSSYSDTVRTYEPTSSYQARPVVAAEPVPYEPRSNASGTQLSATSQRVHTVAKHDTLFKLARLYYSDASRWRDIYNANRGVVTDPNVILVGQQLTIP